LTTVLYNETQLERRSLVGGFGGLQLQRRFTSSIYHAFYAISYFHNKRKGNENSLICHASKK